MNMNNGGLIICIFFVSGVMLSLTAVSSAQGDTCQSWYGNYSAYCTMPKPRPPAYESSCSRYESACFNGGNQGNNGVGNGARGGNQGNGVGNGAGGGNQGNGVGNGASGGNQGNSGGGGVGGTMGQTWTDLTQRAQYDQMQQALANTQQNGANANDCGQYNQHYNVWCGGATQIHPTYCNMMRQVCVTQAQQWARGQGGVNGNAFNSANGLPTGGAGSSRPLTFGQNLGVGPFVELSKTLGINPLQGVGTRQGVNIPIAGLDISGGKSVDYGGLIGVAQLGQLLQGRRRRRRTVAKDLHVIRFGNKLFFAD